MREVTASEVSKDFVAIMDAVQKEPIVVKSQDRESVAIVSMEDFEELQKLKNARLKILAHKIAEEASSNGLTPEILQNILENDL
jgi:prevent-host-death family protein